LHYSFQKLTLSNEGVVKSTPSILAPSTKKIAIVVHVFYIDLWHEISHYLQQLTEPYDLFVTLPEGMPEKDILKIFQTNADAFVYMTENRGRDVLPFLQILSIIPKESHPYICKLHTKKTGASPLGESWRKLLYFDLLSSQKLVSDIISLFESNDDIAIITGKNTILDAQRYAYGNHDKIDFLAESCDVIYDQNYLFPAGTMFWIRASTLQPLRQLFQDGRLVFEEEKGQKDDTLAHAIERFFGILAQVNHQKIVASPSNYAALPKETIENLANLILSQQYAGVDMFLAQKQAIIEKDQHIQNLQELAESLRLKNRLKRLIPTQIKSKIQKLIQLIMLIKSNPQILKKAWFYLIRGEIRYLWSKTKEKAQTNLNEAAHLPELIPSQYFTPLQKEQYQFGDATIDIIIPVYNGYEFLEKLFDSIEAHTSVKHRLIVINDCSPDERVKPYLLERLKKHNNAIFIDHEQNQGFLKSVNEAYSYTSNHFLLLNTDTEVPSFWVERLMYPIFHMENIASTTPFTNSGEIASFPNFVADNPIFDAMDVETLDQVFKEVKNKNFYSAVPTGVGFCMGVNYTLTKEIGMFVEDTFGKGYGEENDWCQRAIQKGYSNLIVPNLFVYHKHGGSFSAQEKAKLLKENSVKLLGRHPNYGKDVDAYITKDPHYLLRHMLTLKAADAKNGTFVLFDHDLGGGATHYTQARIEKYRHERKNILLIKYDFYAKTFKVFHYYKKFDFGFKVETIQELEALLSLLNIQEFFINSLVSYQNLSEIISLILKFLEPSKTKLIIPMHDYNPLCPSYTLLNDKSQYCELPSIETCRECMKKSTQEWHNFYAQEINIDAWRETWQTLLDAANTILCFSNDSKLHVQKVYPTLNEEKIVVEPHRVKPLAPATRHPKRDNQVLTIGILGAINYAKGAQIIKQMIQMIERDNLKVNIVLIGTINETISSKHFNITGKYERENLPTLIAEHQIDLCFIPSIIPETFSYTTQEIILMQLPLMVFNVGAPAERVKMYEHGVIIPEITAKSALETALKTL
jgi:GT2 family glycosyltransferase